MSALNLQHCPYLPDECRRMRGVTMIEFAVSFLALMALTIGMIDMCRLLSIEMLLNKAAQDAATIASKMANIDNDFRNKPASDYTYQWYVDARRRILSEAERLPTSSWLTDHNNPSAQSLMKVTMVDDALLPNGQPAPATTRGAALIRPGERVWFGDPAAIGDTSKGFWANHNKLRYSAPQTLQRTKSLLKYLPLQVEIAAKVDMIFPGLGDKTVRGLGLAYREQEIPQSPLAALPGEPAVTTTTTTTSTTVSTVGRTTTTTVPWGCGPLWLLHFGASTSGDLALCPDPNSGIGLCAGQILCSTQLPSVSH